MSSRPDALRSTLDSLSLDPKVKEDRPYLVSVLRRLGYTEAEIEAHLGPEPEEEPPVEEVVEEAPVEEPVLEAEGPRVVEVEYLGGDDVEEFEPVYRAQGESTTFAIEEEPESPEEGLLEFEEAEGPEEPALMEFRELEPAPPAEQDWPEEEWPEEVAPEEEPPAEPEEGLEFTETTFEVTSQPEENGSRRVGVRVIRAASREEALEKARAMGLDAREAVPVSVEQKENVWPEPVAEEEPVEVPDWPEETEEEPLEESAPAWHEDTREIPDWPEEEEPAAEAVTEEPTWEPVEEEASSAEETEDQEWADEPATPDAPFTYKDYTLHTREVQLSSDRTQRIYFFAKSVPKSGEPCAMPEGYKVKENERTGLPYLTRDRS